MVQKETLGNLEKRALKEEKDLWDHQDQLENEDSLAIKED